jgi:hypothetical protein
MCAGRRVIQEPDVLSAVPDRLEIMATTGTCPKCHKQFPAQPDGTVTKHGPCDVPAGFDQMSRHLKSLVGQKHRDQANLERAKMLKLQEEQDQLNDYIKRMAEEDIERRAQKILAEGEGNPDVLSAWQLAAITLRVDRDWEKYGFDRSQRGQWIAAGIPEFRAQLAYICTQVKDIPGFVFRPRDLAMKTKSGTVLSAVMRGMDSSSLERLIGKTVKRVLDDSPDAWRRTINKARVGETLDRAGTRAMRGRLHHPAEVANLYSTTLRCSDKHWALTNQRYRLRDQAERYLNGNNAQPGAKLLSYARTFGVVAAGPEMRDLAVALKPAHNDDKNLRTMNIHSSNIFNRYLYFVGPAAHADIQERVSNNFNPADVDATRLPSTTGFVWLDSVFDHETFTEIDGAQVLAWQVDSNRLHISLSSAEQTMNDFASPEVTSADSTRQVATIPLTGGLVVDSDSSTVVAFFAAFLDVMEMVSMAGVAAPPAARVSGVGVVRPPAAVTILQTRPRNTWPTMPTTPVIRTHQWTVRGHWRNQWRPSTQDHTRLWIEKHNAGPEDAPLIDRERVRVISGGDPKQQM